MKACQSFLMMWEWADGELFRPQSNQLNPAQSKHNERQLKQKAWMKQIEKKWKGNMETKELKHYKHYFGSRLSEVKKMISAILRVILNFFPNRALCVTESEYKIASLYPRPQLINTLLWVFGNTRQSSLAFADCRWVPQLFASSTKPSKSAGLLNIFSFCIKVLCSRSHCTTYPAVLV